MAKISKEKSQTADDKSHAVNNKPKNTGDKSHTSNHKSHNKDENVNSNIDQNAVDDFEIKEGDSNGEAPSNISSPEDLLAAERDKYLRLAAEYDNFRKRSAKEREMIYSNARIDAISKLLPVYDNLERALKMECSDEAYFKGVEMIMTQLTEVLISMGVREIPAIGETFDPNLHNAVMSIQDPDLGENTIADEYQKGFILGDRVIRFSTVVVANT